MVHAESRVATEAVRVSPQTRRRLAKRKVHRRQPYDDVIRALLDAAERREQRRTNAPAVSPAGA